MSDIFLERLLTVPEVMQRLGLSRSGLYRVVNDGLLRKVTIGRSVRFKESEIRRFIDELESSK